jgi:DNA-binding NarL/FixJ family response regulator
MKPPSSPRKRVFLVDDHPMVRERLSQLIDQQPDLVVSGEADNSREALERIREQVPDIVVVDLTLRNSSGLDLIKDLKAQELRVPVLVLSMHEESLYAERVLRAGALGYVSKQESSQEILAAIRKVIHHQIHLSEQMAAVLLKRLIGGAAAAASPVERLADRELQVFQMIGEGQGTVRIAETLGVSVKTVETYRARIKEKLHLEDAVQLLRAAMRWVETYCRKD